MGEAAFLLQPVAAALVERALMRKQAFLPAGQEYGVELQPLGGMQRHDVDGLLGLAAIDIHYQRDVLEEAGEVLEFLHRAHEFFQVFQAAGGVGGAVLLPHFRVAGFIEDDFREFIVRQRVLLFAPALEIRHQVAQRGARFRLHLVGGGQKTRRFGQRHALLARVVVQHLHGGVAQAALRHIDDALEGQIVGRLRDHAQIGQRIADFGALVEPRTADDAIAETKLDEAFFEFAHLERGAHQNGDLVERMVLSFVARGALHLLDLFADRARFFLAIPGAGDLHLLAIDVLGAQGLAEAAFIVRDQRARRCQNMSGAAIIAFESYDLRAGEVVVETQDVIDLRAAPAIDRLVVVADAADIFGGFFGDN